MQREISLNTENKFLAILKKQFLLIFLIVIIITASLISDVFFTTTNLLNVLRQITIFGVIAFGLTFVLVTGNIDLTVGSVASLAVVMFVDLQKYNYVLAIVVPLVVGLIIGVLNGLIIGKLGVNSVISTLSMMLLIQGFAQLYTRSYVVYGDPASPLLFIGRGYLFKIPFPIILMVFMFLILYVFLHKTVTGKRMFATGGNETVANLYGIKIVRIKILAYIICAICSVIAAFILGGRIKDAGPEAGAIYLFDAITAVILGGTSLYGGKGGIYNTLIGVLIIGVLGNIFVLIGIEYYYQLFFKGIILIIAVWFDIFTRRES